MLSRTTIFFREPAGRSRRAASRQNRPRGAAPRMLTGYRGRPVQLARPRAARPVAAIVCPRRLVIEPASAWVILAGLERLSQPEPRAGSSRRCRAPAAARPGRHRALRAGPGWPPGPRRPCAGAAADRRSPGPRTPTPASSRPARADPRPAGDRPGHRTSRPAAVTTAHAACAPVFERAFELSRG